MSYIKGIGEQERIDSPDWVEENHPENGVFRVYWKDVIGPYEGSVTFDPEEGEGLRYEWYYKDGKRADGLSYAWWPNGHTKSIRTYKNGQMHGLWTRYYYPKDPIPLPEQKQEEVTMKNGKFDGPWSYWKANGQRKKS
jgi:hypothetical protein